MSDPSSLPPVPPGGFWDPFADDPVTPPVSGRTGKSGAKSDTGKSSDDVDRETVDAGPGRSATVSGTPVVAPRPERTTGRVTDPDAELVPTRKKVVIVPDTSRKLESLPVAGTNGGIPTRPTSLPGESQIRSPVRIPVPPPISEDDIYAIREETEPEVVESTPVPSVKPETVVEASVGTGAGPERASLTVENPPDIWRLPEKSRKTVDRDHTTPDGRERNEKDVRGGSWREDGKDGNNDRETRRSPAISVAVTPGQRSRDAVVRKQIERLEEAARERIRLEEQQIRDASLSTWEFFRQGPVIGRMIFLFSLGILIHLLGIIGGMCETMILQLLVLGTGGFLAVFFLAYVMQAAVVTFELAFHRSQRLDQCGGWPVEENGFIEGLFSLRYIFISGMASVLLLIPFQFMLMVLSFLIPGTSGFTIHNLMFVCTAIAGPSCLFFGFPLCYMTALANNDMFEVVPIEFLMTLRKTWRRWGLFYLEQLGIVALLIGLPFLAGPLQEFSPTLYHVLKILVIPPIDVLLILLWHERLG
ncbi:MAG: hypothetical protein Q4C47_07775, partial [Planctomycetia bacterium]|nr:hypothetical protein [Planctomycetia bacterium]